MVNSVYMSGPAHRISPSIDYDRAKIVLIFLGENSDDYLVLDQCRNSPVNWEYSAVPAVAAL